MYLIVNIFGQKNTVEKDIIKEFYISLQNLNYNLVIDDK